MKIAFVLGTRPEIIKMAPVIKELEKRNIEHFVVHTGQHYSYNMDESFFEEISLNKPKFNLGVRSKSPFHQGDHTGRMLTLIEENFLKERPDAVFVQGDTSSAFAGSICTSKLKTCQIDVTLGHLEAGLRSFDRSMPEEINRVVSDSLSDLLFAPTTVSKQNLINENISEDKIFVTGNTIVDALESFRHKIDENLLTKYNLNKKEFFLMTAHRQDNVDIPQRFNSMLEGMRRVSQEFGHEVLYPIHPRSRKMMENLNIKIPSGIRLVDPIGYTDFLTLQKHAKMIFTDSGGIQEEASILGTHCVTLRDNTERPETVDIGCNMIAGVNPESILTCAKKVMELKDWKHPYGDGNSAKKIVDLTLNRIGK